jgi:transglutaminase-like putative cysteine protease
MLDSRVLRAPLLDHREVNLDSAGHVTYVLEQSFRYDYDAPVTSLRHRLVVVPPRRHGNQYRRAHRLEVHGPAAQRRLRRDARGNVIALLSAEHVAVTAEFRFAAVIERIRDDGPTVVPAAALNSPGLLRPTRLTGADDRLRDLATGLGGCAEPPLETAERICALVHDAIRYEDGATSVRTTAAEALAGGRGVCQDSAHVMLAVCHIVGLPARYVSGHLLGQGGTHAWVEVIVPRAQDAIAVAFDPCNGRQADSGYVTVAIGRDYRDVAPTSGTYIGTSRSRLTTSRRVGILAAALSCRLTPAAGTGHRPTVSYSRSATARAGPRAPASRACRPASTPAARTG